MRFTVSRTTKISSCLSKHFQQNSANYFFTPRISWTKKKMFQNFRLFLSAPKWPSSSSSSAAATTCRCLSFLCLFGGVPFLLLVFILCQCQCGTTTAAAMGLNDEAEMAVEHLLERSVRDINGDNDTIGGPFNDNENPEGMIDPPQQQRQADDAGLSIANFFGNISASARAKLYSVVNNPNMTKQQMGEALDAWASEQGQPLYTVYRGLKSAYETARQQLDQRHAALMQNQSQAVREADAKMQTIDNNQFNTLAEEQHQMAEQMAQFSPDVQQVLLQLAPYPQGKK